MKNGHQHPRLSRRRRIERWIARNEWRLPASVLGPSYVLVDGGKAIKCLVCGRTSYNPNDVVNLYCGHCHTFHVPAGLLGENSPEQSTAA